MDQGYQGKKPAAAAGEHGIELEVVKLPEAKRGFVLLPRRWVVEHSFAWATRFRRLVKDYERCASTLADSISAPSSASCSNTPLYSLKVHDSPWRSHIRDCSPYGNVRDKIAKQTSTVSVLKTIIATPPEARFQRARLTANLLLPMRSARAFPARRGTIPRDPTPHP